MTKHNQAHSGATDISAQVTRQNLDESGHEHGDEPKLQHNHDAGHSHAPASYGKAFAIGIILNTGFVIVEVVFGLLSNSLALVADAGHNLSDVLGLCIAWVASILVKRQPTRRHTYGLRRSSILAALANAVFLLVAIGAIAWEAIKRFSEPGNVQGSIVIGVALVGIAINTATALLFMSGRKNDLNIKGAYLHMAADAGVSAGVVVAGLVILFTGWVWIDPVVSLIIVVVIFLGTWGLLRDSVNLALDAVPENIKSAEVELYLMSLPQVVEVHDLHIWAMSTTETALTAHLVVRNPREVYDSTIERAVQEMRDKYGIEHCTLQIESGDPAHPCHYCVPVPANKETYIPA